jgi:TolB-like protein/DNA-binding winged helix-turn-helix (wHTH) protein
MNASPHPPWQFGAFALDPVAEELFKGGRKVALHGQPLRLLTLLLERAGQVVTREEIQAHLWPPGTHVEVDQGINAGIRQIRRALGDSATAPRYLETLPRKGYRFLAPVQRPTSADAPAADVATPTPSAAFRPGVVAVAAVLTVALAALFLWEGRQPSPPAPPSPAPDSGIPRPVLVVLPFEYLGDEAGYDYLPDALTEEVISHLGGRYPERLAVIARTTTMRYKGTPKSIREIAAELQADFLLESSVRIEGERVRVTAQLIDAADASHLWAANYDRIPESLLAFQEEVSSRIADTVATRLELPSSTAPSTSPPPPSWQGYLLYLKGLEVLHREEPGSVPQARQLFEEALRQDPTFAPAHVGLARASGGRDPVAALASARRSLDRALALDPELPEAHLARGELLLYQAFDLPGAKRALDRALELRPAYAEALHHRAAWFAAHGDTAAVRRDMDRARRLDPLSAAVRSDVGFFAYFDHRWDEALEHSLRTLELEPGHLWAQQCIALTLGELERTGNPLRAAAWKERYAVPLAHLLGVPESVPFDEVPRAFWEARWKALTAREAHGLPPLHGEKAVARMALGDAAGALGLLQLAADTHSGWMIPFLGVHPLFARLDPASLPRPAGASPPA